MFINLINSLKFIMRHPLVKGARWLAFKRWLIWQISSRLLQSSVIFHWVNGSRLIVRQGMAGATGNYYCGLHEFADMGFLLHYLRVGDLFLDLGANIGSYTILAAVATGAKVVSVEPIPSTFALMVDNIHINDIGGSVEAKNVGLGSETGLLLFSTDLDAENHVLGLADGQQNTGVAVPVVRLDELVAGQCPSMIKLDVEGYESAVLLGGVNTFATPSLKAVLIELNGAGARYGYKDDDIRKQFRGWGFEACRYDPVTRVLDAVDDQEASQSGNTLYVRGIADVQQRLKMASPFRVLGHTI